MKIPFWLVFGIAFVFCACVMTWGLADHHAVLRGTEGGLSSALRYPWGLVVGIGGGAACIVVIVGGVIRSTK